MKNIYDHEPKPSLKQTLARVGVASGVIIPATVLTLRFAESGEEISDEPERTVFCDENEGTTVIVPEGYGLQDLALEFGAEDGIHYTDLADKIPEYNDFGTIPVVGEKALIPFCEYVELTPDNWTTNL